MTGHRTLRVAIARAQGRLVFIGGIASLATAAAAWGETTPPALQVATSAPVAAPAQQEAAGPGAPAEQPPAQTIESVVITGSRIARAGFEAPTPVSVVGADRLEHGAPPTSATS